MMMYLPQYVQLLFPDFNHLYLVVDTENEGAWNVYERAGFMHTATKEEGPIGKERLYYLDLDSKHVSSLKLVENKNSNIAMYQIIDLLKMMKSWICTRTSKYSSKYRCNRSL